MTTPTTPSDQTPEKAATQNAMLKWWSLQHQATREACIMAGIACIALCSLLIHRADVIDPALNNALLQPSKTYRVDGPHGQYSLLFQNTHALIGNNQFLAYGRIKPSEVQTLQKSLLETQIIRNLGKAQLDLEQQAAYGLNQGIRLDAPGQDPWTIGTGSNGHGYALDNYGTLFQLDRDLGGQLNRSPNALRANTLGIPQHLSRIQREKQWTLAFFRERWWLAQGENSHLADQNICTDWLNVLQETQAISFVEPTTDPATNALFFEGHDSTGNHVIRFCDRGIAPGTKHYRIIERHQEIGSNILKEAFIVNLNERIFNFPAQGFLSKHLIPFDVHEAQSITINNIQLTQKEKQWWIDSTVLASEDSIQTLLDKLSKLPSVSSKTDTSIGKILTGSLEFLIPQTNESLVLSKIKRHEFADKRLFPRLSEKQITGLVIHDSSDVPQFYQKLDDKTWDIDPETHAEISDFINALAAARVSTWEAAYDPAVTWSSTLTIAIGDKRIIIKKTDDHLIGIEAANLQGHLDKASISDLFGP